MVLGVDKKLQTRVPEYTRALQALEESATAQSELEKLVGREDRVEEEILDDYGAAPDFQDIDRWFNSAPLSLRDLRGKVVLVDFWTYSCVNCLRTLPHVRGWHEAYRDKGLVIVGVHTPEFAFERVPGNVGRAVRGSASSTRLRSTTTTQRGRRGATATGRPSTSSTGAVASATPTRRRGLRGERARHPHAPGRAGATEPRIPIPRR